MRATTRPQTRNLFAVVDAMNVATAFVPFCPLGHPRTQRDAILTNSVVTDVAAAHDARAPILVPLAAVGLALVMVGAVAVHARRKETMNVVVNVVLIAMAVFVAWGRFGPYSFTS